MESGENLKEALERELLEEANTEIAVDKVALLYECEPQFRDDDYSPQHHTLFIIFECRIQDGSEPCMPIHPEINQTGVRWIPVNKLNEIKLVPNIAIEIIRYKSERNSIKLIEDHVVR